MREKEFIEKNRDKWRDFENELSKRKSDPHKLSKLYIQITDDLSYARSKFNNRTVRFYLNTLSQNLYLSVHKNRIPGKDNIRTFWFEELPALLYHARKDLLISLAVFSIAMLIGMFSTHQDPDFARAILGDDYVNKTLDNIDKGDPGAIYKDPDAFGMFLQITINNIYVSFLVFVLGILAGVGTVGLLISNGVMVGTFQYFFITQGVGAESALVIWQHGTIEISSIVIAGAAGIVLGKGFIFPGSYTRAQSLKNSAQRALKIMLGLVPMFVLAGFIESFVTRQTELHTLIRIAVIVLSAALILGYYVVWPFKLPREVKNKYKFSGLNRQFVPTPVLLNIRKTQSQLFKETFITSKNVIALIPAALLLISAAGSAIILSFSPEVYTGLGASTLYSLHGLQTFFDFSQMPQHFTLFTFTTALISFLTFVKLNTTLKLNLQITPKKFLIAFLLTALISCVFFIPGITQFLVFLLILPLYINTLINIYTGNVTAAKIFMPFKKPGFIFGSYLGVSLLSFGILILLNQPVTGLYSGQILQILPVEEDTASIIGEFLLFFMQQLTFLILTAVFTVYGLLTHYHQLEMHTAGGLIQKLQNLKSQLEA